METWLYATLFAVGLAGLVKGADWFTYAAVGIAAKTGIPRTIIGATIVSLATTLPEFAVSVLSSWEGHPDLAVGNAVGSTIANIGLILALVMILRPFSVADQSFLKRSGFMLGAGALVYLLGRDGIIVAVDGAGLGLLLVVYIFFNLGDARNGREDGVGRPESPAVLAFFFLIGAAMVVAGSRLLVIGGTSLAVALGIPELLIALTMVAIGTSLPELVTSITAALKGHQDLSLGNILGANFLDLTWVLMGSSFAGCLTLTPKVRNFDLPVMLVIFALLAYLGIGRRFSRWHGLALLALYLLYVTALVFWFEV